MELDINIEQLQGVNDEQETNESSPEGDSVDNASEYNGNHDPDDVQDQPGDEGENEDALEQEIDPSAPSAPHLHQPYMQLQAVPIQPYYQPPYPYYHPIPGYPMHMVPSLGCRTGISKQSYHDASTLTDSLPDTRRNRGGVTEPFPEKLHNMIQYAEREGLADVVSFFPHGRAFAIHKPRRFVVEVMSRFFRQTRLTSFQRQLNLYGFQRISQGPDNGGYYHELFLQGRPGLSVNMKRTKIKGGTKSKSDPDSEPNFYGMRSITALGDPMAPQPGNPAPAYYPPPLQPGYGYYVAPPPPQQYMAAGPPTAPYTAAQQATGALLKQSGQEAPPSTVATSQSAAIPSSIPVTPQPYAPYGYPGYYPYPGNWGPPPPQYTPPRQQVPPAPATTARIAGSPITVSTPAPLKNGIGDTSLLDASEISTSTALVEARVESPGVGPQPADSESTHV